MTKSNEWRLSFAAFVALMFAQSSAYPGLLEVNLSVIDEITITATSGTSAATVSGPDFTGIYLDDFFAFDPADGDLSGSNVGTLTSALNVSDGSPRLWNRSGFDDGANIYSFVDGITADFIMGQLAFTGTATWSVSSTAYSAALAGAPSGNIYFPADRDDNIPGATLLGTWHRKENALPVPAPIALIGLGLAGIGYKRYRKVA